MKTQISSLPQRILMARPDFFDVAYSINPYMQDDSGQLKKVDQPKARLQWEALRDCYQSLGFKVEILPSAAGLCDLVFAANQSFPYWDQKLEKPAVILSQMRSNFRRPEVALFQQWYQQQGYQIHHLSNPELCFEGNGDALLHPDGRFIWGGAGPRTDAAVYQEISQITEKEVVVLDLIDPNFYHLDTCFSLLNQQTVVIQPKAFSEESLQKIKARFSQVIETSFSDCTRYFTGNCHSPNGKDIILQQGCLPFEEELKALGFTIHPLETSEFMKSGGSVFCMKMMCY